MRKNTNLSQKQYGLSTALTSEFETNRENKNNWFGKAIIVSSVCTFERLHKISIYLNSYSPYKQSWTFSICQELHSRAK
jgi:hypothetical protein